MAKRKRAPRLEWAELLKRTFDVDLFAVNDGEVGLDMGLGVDVSCVDALALAGAALEVHTQEKP